jgi:hypothetical protein
VTAVVRDVDRRPGGPRGGLLQVWTREGVTRLVLLERVREGEGEREMDRRRIIIIRTDIFYYLFFTFIQPGRLFENKFSFTISTWPR